MCFRVYQKQEQTQYIHSFVCIDLLVEEEIYNSFESGSNNDPNLEIKLWNNNANY